MEKPSLTGSAVLHLRIGAFTALFSLLVVSFGPIIAFILAVATTVLLRVM